MEIENIEKGVVRNRVDLISCLVMMFPFDLVIAFGAPRLFYASP